MTRPIQSTKGNKQGEGIACYFDASKLDSNDIALLLEMIKEEHAGIREYFENGGDDRVLLSGLDEAEDAIKEIENKCIFTIS